VNQFCEKPELSGRVRSAKVARLAREFETLARKAVAGSERLAGGPAAALAVARGRTAEWRDGVVCWV
jgi:hypothetical protein